MLGKRYSTPTTLTDSLWDLVVVGGGITGAGIALQAAKLNKRVLLLEQKDFSWGTSSRSSKMVHGGLRYLAQGDIKLTRQSLLERERLLTELPDLVVRKTYLFPIIEGQFPGRWSMTCVLWLYDLLAGIRDHSWLPLAGLRQRLPQLRLPGIKGAMSYTDALTDDCRLVLQLLHEAQHCGATLSNYTRVDSINRQGEHFLVNATDQSSGQHLPIRAKKVVNATGAFADRLSGANSRVRPLRGSHLFFSAERLPVSDCLTMMHPDDKRPVFIFSWQGVTCVGTTDLDHDASLDQEACASQVEVDYLLAVINALFPSLEIEEGDIVSCMAGVRPVISSGRSINPSKERRDHAIWQQDGVITVSGGKLTTFRLIALDVLKSLGWLSHSAYKDQVASKASLISQPLPYLLGNPLESHASGELLESQIAWILDNEMVVHLDDLMLRRTRLGLLLPDAGSEVLATVKPLCLTHLGWSEERWATECQRYLEIVYHFYQPPARKMTS